MDAVREVSSVANALRKKEGKRVRLPLPRLTVVVPDAEALAQFEDILRDELNVKAVELVELERARRSTTASRTACRSTPAPPVPRLGKQVQQVIAAARAGSGRTPTARRRRRDRPGAGEYDLVLETAGRPDGEALAVLTGAGDRQGGFVLLDTDDARARSRGSRARHHPRRAGHPQGRRLRRERPHPPAAAVLRIEDAAAVASAFATADVAGETLALDYAVVSPEGTALVGEGSVLAAAETIDADHTAVVAAGTYANTGDVTVAVTRIGASS
jgi:isoleucyl-tRNA synthetase